jgi:hypothetical protein
MASSRSARTSGDILFSARYSPVAGSLRASAASGESSSSSSSSPPFFFLLFVTTSSPFFFFFFLRFFVVVVAFAHLPPSLLSHIRSRPRLAS